MNHPESSLEPEFQPEFPADQLAAPARRALAGAGYTSLEALAEVSEGDIAQLHGIGPHALRTLRNALEEHGMSFAGESD